MGKRDVRTIHRPEYATLIGLIVKAREEAGLSQREVSRRVGLAQASVWSIEQCSRRLDALELLEFAVVIGFDPGELLKQVKELHPESFKGL